MLRHWQTLPAMTADLQWQGVIKCQLEWGLGSTGSSCLCFLLLATGGIIRSSCCCLQGPVWLLVCCLEMLCQAKRQLL